MPAAPSIQVTFPTWVQDGSAGAKKEGVQKGAEEKGVQGLEHRSVAEVRGEGGTVQGMGHRMGVQGLAAKGVQKGYGEHGE